ncbi:MAG: transporter substrate-binding domain-containing protein [Rugosibacter sp.]
MARLGPWVWVGMVRSSHVLAILFVLLTGLAEVRVEAATLQTIQSRGHLVCGVRQDQPAFAVVDARGHYSGMEVDICRALAVVILGSPEQVQFVPVEYVQHFVDDAHVDVVLHGLTHTLDRERKFDITFSSVYFYDGQGFMVPRSSGIQSADQLQGRKVCLRRGGEAEKNMNKYAQGKFKLILSTEEALAQDEFLAGKCDAYTADVSLMIAMLYSKPVSSTEYQVLPQRISKEPLAAITRRSDQELSHALNAVMSAIVEAEERGITSADATEGVEPEKLSRFAEWAAPFMPQLPGDWAVHVVRSVGNYGEIYNRNLARAREYGIERGLNRPWNAGGIMYALPVH